MPRVAALLAVVALVAELSRLDGHAPRPAAAAAPRPPYAASVVRRGLTRPQVRRVAGRADAHLRGTRCALYVTGESLDRRMETSVCFARRGRVASVWTGHPAQLREPSP